MMSKIARYRNTKNAQPCAQYGQALVEFIVLGLVVIPLFLLMPMIAKYQDISHATQMASRYVAFEATTHNDSQSAWKSEAELAGDVRRRFFSNSDAPVKTADTAGDFDAHRTMFWRDPYGHALINNFNDVSISFGNGGSTHADAFSAAPDAAPFSPIPLANAGRIGLGSRGVYTANVAVSLANLPTRLNLIKPFDSLNLSVNRHTSLIFDGWDARSPDIVNSRVNNLVPAATTYSVIQPVVDLAIDVVDMTRIRPPAVGQLDRWSDLVPADRLVQP